MKYLKALFRSRFITLLIESTITVLTIAAILSVFGAYVGLMGYIAVAVLESGAGPLLFVLVAFSEVILTMTLIELISEYVFNTY